MDDLCPSARDQHAMAAPHQDQHRRWSANFWHGSSEVLTMSDAAREIIVLTKNDGELTKL